MAKVLIPTPLRQFAGKQDSVDLSGSTVGEVLNGLTSQFNDLRKHLYNDEGTDTVSISITDVAVQPQTVVTGTSTAQVNEATAVASVVVMNAFAAIPSGASALPALKPYQPTQSNPVPTMQRTMLCGAMTSFLNPSRWPRRMQRTSADQPEDMCTTVPPAKSMARTRAAGFQTPFIQPSIPHTMCAIGK